MTAPSVQVLIGLGPPNLLDDDDASFEGSSGSWNPGLTASAAQSTAEALDGTHSLLVTLAADPGILQTANYAAIPNVTYAVMASFRAQSTIGKVAVNLFWYDAGVNLIRTDYGSEFFDASTGWGQSTLLSTAPGNAAFVSVGATIAGSPGDEHYIDCAGLFLFEAIPTWTLAQTQVDVSQWLSGAVTGTRGRSREVDQYQAGQFQFTLRNESRDFDPSNTASPYAPGILPRSPVQILVAGEQIFGGPVDDIAVVYVQPDICTVTVTCLDTFNLLANTYLSNYNAVDQLSGARISAILARPEVSFPTAPAPVVATGLSRMQANTFNNVDALSTSQTVATSEQGFLYVDRTGVLRFHDRDYVGTLTNQLTFSDVPADLAAGDPGYQGITQKSQALLLYNSVQGTRTGGTQQVVGNEQSQLQYEIRTLSLPSLENETDTDVYQLCGYLAGRYAQPDVRFDTVMIEMQALTSTQQAAVAALDLVDLVTVKRTPPGSGSPTTIEKLSIIDQIAWSLNVSTSQYQVILSLGSIDTRNFFQLDDSVFGILDTSLVGF